MASVRGESVNVGKHQKIMRQLCLSVLAGLCLTAASAFGSMSFNYSYTSGTEYGYSPFTATGTLSGTQVGDTVSGYVTGVSVQSLFINGTQVLGTLYNAHRVSSNNDYNSGTWVQSGSAVVSFLQSQNNFIFINSDYANNQGGYTGFFYNVAAWPQAQGYNANPFGYDADIARGNWSLTAVPEPSTYLAGALMLLPFAASTVRRLGKNRTA